MADAKAIGELCRAARARAGLTVEEVVARMHRPGAHGTVWAWLRAVERGDFVPLPHDQPSLLAAYGAHAGDALYAALGRVPPDVQAVTADPARWPLQRALDAIGRQAVVAIDYTNWRGERAVRRVQPRALTFEATTHHPVAQWLLHGLCLDRGEVRAFAVANIHAWTVEAPRG